MVPGESVHSLAFEVAEKVGVPRAVLDLADTYLARGGALPAAPQQRSARQAAAPADSPGAPAAPLSLDEAASLLAQTAGSRLNAPPPPLYTVGPGETVPSSATSRTVVYLLHIPGEPPLFYCGETSDMRGRLQAHRQKYGAGIEGRYLFIPEGSAGKGKAREVETATIVALQERRVPLVAAGDADNRNFGL